VDFINALIRLTRTELEFLIAAPRRSEILTNKLERYFLYVIMDGKANCEPINLKTLQSFSKKSFYHCDKAVKKLIDEGWVISKTNYLDKRSKVFLPTQKATKLVKAFEAIKYNTLIKKGMVRGKLMSKYTLEDLVRMDAGELAELRLEIE
jgi:hypothetical protein